MGSNASAPLVEVRNLKKHFTIQDGTFGPRKTVRAVDGVGFSVFPQESFGLVGESGCGKSTLGRLLLALETPTEGEVFFEGDNIYAMPRSKLRMLRREMQVIFQDPYSSLDPRMTVRQILSEPFYIHGTYSGRKSFSLPPVIGELFEPMAGQPEKLEKRLHELAHVVGLAKAHLDRYPHEFSGGQRQRIGIARALALNPKLIVADEPVSALDVSIQAQILNLLKDLQKEFHLTYLFISHDFSVVRHLCHRIAVMYLGKIVEVSDGEVLFEDPQHPYTEALLSAVPIPDPAVERKRKRVLLTGDVPSPMSPPPGCHFHPRCRYMQESCRTHPPSLEEAKNNHWVACPILPFKERPSEAALAQ